MPVTNGTTTDAAAISSNVVENKNSVIGKKVHQIEERNIRKNEPLNEKENEITLEDLAPDGGWGWMIAFGMILSQVGIVWFI